MQLATWNLNNRVGKVRFRPEAADAAVALGADVLVLTEFFPQEHENRFRNTLRNAGLSEQVMSPQPAEVANRVLIASRLPLVPLAIEGPTFDQQFRANVAAVSLPSIGLSIVGVRVPAYGAKQSAFLIQAWDWLESTAAMLRLGAAVMLGDLNASSASPVSRGGCHFRRILASGWQRAAPADGPTYFGHGGRTSEIDSHRGDGSMRPQRSRLREVSRRLCLLRRAKRPLRSRCAAMPGSAPVTIPRQSRGHSLCEPLEAAGRGR